jgi:hypothetical protein
MIKSEVRSLLILKPVIAPSLIRDCPLTIVSLEVLIKLQPLQSKPLGLAITTAAFLPNTSKAPFNTDYDYTTGEVKSNTNAAPIEFGIDISHLSNISAGSIKLIVTEKGAGVNTADGDIITCQLPTLIVNGIGSNG